VEKAGVKENPDLLETGLLSGNLDTHRKVVAATTGKKEKRLIESLLERYEIEQLKTALRVWHKKAPAGLAESLYGDKIKNRIDYKRIAHAPSLDEILFLLGNTPYARPLAKAREKYETTNSLFYLEVALDIDYYQRLDEMVQKLSKTDRVMAKTILGVEIDIENIHWLIRLRKYYSLNMGEILEWIIPGGSKITKSSIRGSYISDDVNNLLDMVSPGPYTKIKDLGESNNQQLEEFLSAALKQQARKALSGFPFTIGTVLGYLVLKKDETRNLISLLYAKKFGWEKEQIDSVIH
jgi:V/A-type H+-transporting ATPase subunit C